MIKRENIIALVLSLCIKGPIISGLGWRVQISLVIIKDNAKESSYNTFSGNHTARQYFLKIVMGINLLKNRSEERLVQQDIKNLA